MACDPLSSTARSLRRRKRFKRRVQTFFFNTVFCVVFFLVTAWALSLKPAHAQYPGGSGYPCSLGYPGYPGCNSPSDSGGMNTGLGTNTGYPGGTTGGTSGGTNTGYPGGTTGGTNTGYPGGTTGGNTGTNTGYPGGNTGTNTGGYPGGGWQAQTCDANGNALPNPMPDANGYLPMSVTQTVTATDTYPADCDTLANNSISFSPNHVSNPPYFAGGSVIGGYPGGGANTAASAGNGVYYTYTSGTGLFALSNGSVTEKSSSTFSAYYKWAYVGGTPPAPGTPGAAPPTGLLSLLVHTTLSAQTQRSATVSGLSATATVSDSLAGADQLSQSSPGSLSLDTYHLIQAGFSGNIAAVSFTGTGLSNAVNFVPSSALNGSGYPTTTNGSASANASTFLFAGSRPFTASLQAAATGQPLSTAPAFFFGPACPVQANAQAIGGSVTEVKLLVDGKVIQDVTSTAGQSSLTVSATFDSLVYTEGYNLPIIMQVWDSTGHSYDCTLKAVVHLPQVQFSDLWTPDYTAAPVGGQVPQTAASTGGVIGGNTTLHLRSQYGALTLTQVRLHLHRDTDITKDTVFAAPALASPAITSFGPPVVYSLWDARCGDPDPSLPTSLPSQYVNLPWNVGGRNGVYDVTATFTATGASGVVHTLTSAATFDREDLLITATTPANPTPLLWDPNNPSLPNPIALSVAFSCAYKQSGTVTLQIFRSDQALVKTLTQAFTTKDGSVRLNWDGTADPVSNQPPGQFLGSWTGPQARGVYLFQWTVSDTLGVTDSDKSPWLSVTQTESALTGDYNAVTDQNTTKDGCVLTDTVTAPANASAATVQVFGGDSLDMAPYPSPSLLAFPDFRPMAQIVAPLPLAALTTNAPGSVSPVWDELSYPESIQIEEVHLLSAQDNHADIDRGGACGGRCRKTSGQIIRWRITTMLCWLVGAWTSLPPTGRSGVGMPLAPMGYRPVSSMSSTECAPTD